MIASIGFRPCSSTAGNACTTSITAPPGWTQVRIVDQTQGGGTGGSGLRLAIYRKVVTAAEAVIANYTWAIGGAPTHNGAAGVISSFINVDTSNPIVIESGQTTLSGTSHATADLGVLATNTMLVTTHAALSAATWAPPAGMTEIFEFASQANLTDGLGMSIEINNEQRPSPGPTGIRTATFSSATPADRGATLALALRPIQADPTIAMTRSGTLTIGTPASYTLTIGNLGPQPISAANLTVTNTLPAGLTFTSTSGTGWVCGAAGQIVTCTRSGAALPSGSFYPTVTINVNVVSGVLWTNNATVSAGADGDNDLTNSSASNTGPDVTTTLGTGTDPAAITIAPGPLPTDVNNFTLQTNSATEPISAITVNLSSNLGVDRVEITNTAGTVIYGTATAPPSGLVAISMIGLTANTTLQTFKVRVTPLDHITMPVPPGGTYTVTAPVASWTGPAAHIGTDTDVALLTIDNASPNSATATSGSAGTQNTTLNWTTSNSADFNTTNGSVIYRWLGASAGTEVPIEGTTPPVNTTNGAATVVCVRSSAASTALTAIDGTGGTAGCSTTALTAGQIYTYKVFQRDINGNYDVGVVIGSFGAATPGSFNAFETATVAASLTGAIKTKIAGAVYSLDLIAINSGGTAVMATFTGDVTVDLIANAATGVSVGADNCPSSGTTLAVGTRTITAGRSTISFPAEANAWRDVRVRISYPTTSPTITICSTDNFAMRPSAFTLAASDSSSSTAGLTRALNNIATTGGFVHKAGSPFTISGSAVNAAGVPAVTSNYVNTPTVSISSFLTPATCTTCTLNVGTITGAAGSLVTSTATYSEVGTFVLQAVDTTFASVDATDSSTVERYINGTTNVGRFVPDHFDVVLGQNGAMQTACGTGFTFTGQAMGYQASALPTLTIRPMNAVSAGSVTQNYQGVLQKLVASGVTVTTPTADGLQVGRDAVTLTSLLAAMTTGDLTNVAGTMTYTLKATDTFTYTRNANALIGPYTSTIRLVATGAAEPVGGDGVVATGAMPTLTPTGASVRYGRVRMQNVYGSEQLDLAMPMQSESLNASGAWVLNTLDTCTNTTLAFTPVGTDITGSTCVWDTGSAPGNSGQACTTPILVPSRQFKETLVAGFAGDFNLWLKKPTAGTTGSITVTATVPTWLQFDWTGSGPSNPTARATFGVYKSPLIYRRENY